MFWQYANAWKSLYGEFPEDKLTKVPTSSGEIWAEELRGISPEQIETGIEECRFLAGNFPPNPPRFRALCLGVISFPIVKDQILKGDKSNPFTRMVSSKLDFFLYRSSDANNASGLIKEAYDVCYEAVLRGESLPEMVKKEPIPQKKIFTPSPPEIAEKHLTMIRELLA